MHHMSTTRSKRYIMGNEHQRGAALGVPGEQQIDDLLSGVLVEIAGRLIGHDDLWIGRKRTRDCDTLLLAARKLSWIMIEPLAQAHRSKLVARTRVRILDTSEFKRDRHVFQRGHGLDQMERLKYDADMTPPKARQRVLVERTQVDACDRHRPAVGTFEARHHHQERRL